MDVYSKLIYYKNIRDRLSVYPNFFTILCQYNSIIMILESSLENYISPEAICMEFTFRKREIRYYYEDTLQDADKEIAKCILGEDCECDVTDI